MSAADVIPRQPGGVTTLAGHRVARIGFGAMQLAGGHGRPPGNRKDAVAILRAAVDAGVNHIDTAEFYGQGVANELIHAALHPYPAGLVLVSKVGAVRDSDGGWVSAQRPEQLRAGVEANLRTLDTERLGAVNLRLMGGGAHNAAQTTGEDHVDLDSQLAEMIKLRDEGKIGGIGLSNCTLDELQQAVGAGVACVQNAYSLVDRSAEPLLELCRRHDIAWVPFFPLGSAFPGQPKVAEQPAVIGAATALGVTPAQVGLAWLLAHDAQTLLIPGTSNVAHLEQNLAAGDVRLDAATVAALDAVS